MQVVIVEFASMQWCHSSVDCGREFGKMLGWERLRYECYTGVSEVLVAARLPTAVNVAGKLPRRGGYRE